MTFIYERPAAEPELRKLKALCSVFSKHHRKHRPTAAVDDARRVAISQQWSAAIMSVPQASAVGRTALKEQRVPRFRHCVHEVHYNIARIHVNVHFPFCEQTMYQYVKHLADKQAAASSMQSYVEAVRFTWPCLMLREVRQSTSAFLAWQL